MALNLVQGYGYVDDGLIGYVPRYPISCSHDSNNLNEEDLDKKIAEALNKLHISDDEVSFNNKTMKDDYVTSGKYNGDGTATLNVGASKTATIEDLPKPMSTDDVKDILK